MKIGMQGLIEPFHFLVPETRTHHQLVFRRTAYPRKRSKRLHQRDHVGFVDTAHCCEHLVELWNELGLYFFLNGGRVLFFVQLERFQVPRTLFIRPAQDHGDLPSETDLVQFMQCFDVVVIIHVD